MVTVRDNGTTVVKTLRALPVLLSLVTACDKDEVIVDPDEWVDILHFVNVRVIDETTVEAVFRLHDVMDEPVSPA